MNENINIIDKVRRKTMNRENKRKNNEINMKGEEMG